MIALENITSNVVKVTVPEKLAAEDFQEIAPAVDELVQQYGNLRILVDASKFDGWKNITAFERHMTFVRDHQKKILRGALIAGHAWHHWLAGVIRLFVHPEIKVFDKGEEAQALQWISAM